MLCCGVQRGTSAWHLLPALLRRHASARALGLPPLDLPGVGPQLPVLNLAIALHVITKSLE